MKLDLQIQNLDRVRDSLAKLSGPQAKNAFAKAINDTGFMVRKAMQTEFSKFDRVTPFILKSRLQPTQPPLNSGQTPP